MEHDIIRKLRAELERGISSESQVVYVLVKIRRLLDLDKDQGATATYSTLRLYCNWALHIKLSYSQARKIVTMADSFYPKLERGELTEQEKNEFRSVFSLTAFRGELNRFLTDKHLPAFCDAEWNSFLACFLNTIEDCPLVCKAKGVNTSEVDEVVLTKEVGDSDRTADGNPPPIIWALCFRGQPRIHIVANLDFSDEAVQALADFSQRRNPSTTPEDP